MLLIIFIMVLSVNCAGQNRSSPSAGHNSSDKTAVQEDDYQPSPESSTQNPEDSQDADAGSPDSGPVDSKGPNSGRSDSGSNQSAYAESQAVLDETLKTLDELEAVVNSLDEIEDSDLEIPN